MGRLAGNAPCPRCRSRGQDTRGDNLAEYQDGSAHCFACGYHRHAKTFFKPKEVIDDREKEVLPRDFTREVPATAWKWLLQYGLPYSYWKPFTGYSPAEERLILTVGRPVRFSIGRYIPATGAHLQDRSVSVSSKAGDVLPVRTPGKWKVYGDRHRYAELLDNSNSNSNEGVIVEDIISAHKVSHVAPALALFGTNVHKEAIQALRKLGRPLAIWLDEDQYGNLPKKINRLQTFLNVPVRLIRSRKDPKKYSFEEIKEILKDESMH